MVFQPSVNLVSAGGVCKRGRLPQAFRFSGFRLVPQQIHLRQGEGTELQTASFRQTLHRVETDTELRGRLIEELLRIQLPFAGKIYHREEQIPDLFMEAI